MNGSLYDLGVLLDDTLDDGALDLHRPRRISYGVLFQRIASWHARLGGSTFDFRRRQAALNGFAVSLKTVGNVAGRLVSPRFLWRCARPLVVTLMTAPFHLGTWWDAKRDESSVDVTVVVPDEDKAHSIARVCNQQAIYDLRANATIPV